VLKVLRKELDEDRTKTYVMEISPLGLVEMTRQNVTDGVREILTKTCPTCEGEGVVLSEETVALETERRLRDLVNDHPEPEAYLVKVHPRVSGQLLGAEAGRPLLELEREVGKHFHFEGSEGLPLDWFELVETGTRDEIEQRALPFREGEELLVQIEEPHMYDEEAAVGKIDSYVISVAGAGRLIGEERLVRITEVGRTSASAEVVGGVPEGGEEDDGDRPQRRRGRRGGRGRRRTSASG
jgi:ribonuclease G